MADKQTIRFKLNGRSVEASVAHHETLVETLRNQFQLYGCRESCGQGLCGACTVVVDGSAVSGCLYLAALTDGTEVTTVEGLGLPGALSPIQEAFVSCQGFQCGFCTPGFVMMSNQLLAENRSPTEDQIKHYLSGNLCRCAAYPEIIKAVQTAATKL